MEVALLDFLKNILQAKYAQKPHKASFLLRAQAELELANRTVLFQIQGKTIEIGRMLGAWLKSLYVQ